MPKNAISVTLDADNLVWLRARAGSGQGRSVSELIDRIVTEARTRGAGGGAKSVVGTIDVDAADPLLLKADEAIGALFGESLGRPMAVPETRAGFASKRTRRRG